MRKLYNIVGKLIIGISLMMVLTLDASAHRWRDYWYYGPSYYRYYYAPYRYYYYDPWYYDDYYYRVPDGRFGIWFRF